MQSEGKSSQVLDGITVGAVYDREFWFLKEGKKHRLRGGEIVKLDESNLKSEIRNIRLDW